MGFLYIYIYICYSKIEYLVFSRNLGNFQGIREISFTEGFHEITKISRPRARSRARGSMDSRNYWK